MLMLSINIRGAASSDPTGGLMISLGSSGSEAGNLDLLNSQGDILEAANDECGGG